jgi:hypothetical protein
MSQNTNFITSVFTEHFALFGVRILTAARNFNLRHKAGYVLGVHQNSYEMDTKFFLGVMAVGA